MRFNYSKLNGRIVERFGSQRAFAEALNRSENNISRKLCGKTAISVEEIMIWSSASLLDIPAEEIPAYFFTLEVQDVELSKGGKYEN